MMKIATIADAREIDQQSTSIFQYPPVVLMESAGVHIWHRIRQTLTVKHDSILILCGSGNNGGDGLVIARHAYNADYRVSVVDCTGREGKRSELNKLQRAMCLALQIPIFHWHTQANQEGANDRDKILLLVQQCNCIVDAIIGIGMRGGIKDDLKPLVSAVNKQSSPIYSVDVPSGIGANLRTTTDTVIRATLTYTIELPKLSCFTPLARPLCGKIQIVPIGFPIPLIKTKHDDSEHGYLLTKEDLPKLYRPLNPFHYKHTRGVIAVYGGSEITTGALLLASDSAIASGVGIVHVFPSAQSDLGATIALARPAYITHTRVPLSDKATRHAHNDNTDMPPVDATTHSAPTTIPNHCDALCIGPGWGVNSYTRTLFSSLLKQSIPQVIDADALTLLSEWVDFDEENETLTINGLDNGTALLEGKVLTPHCAEFARLLGIETARVLRDPLPLLVSCVTETKAVIVLKSYITYIVGPSVTANGKQTAVSNIASATPDTPKQKHQTRYTIFDGNEITLATGGSGDVLAGIIATLLAQKYPPFEAAQTAVLIHHQAAQEARKARGGYYSATDLIRFVSRVILPQEH